MAIAGKLNSPLDMGTLRDVLTELFTVQKKSKTVAQKIRNLKKK
jgi:hypothetical protein